MKKMILILAVLVTKLTFSNTIIDSTTPTNNYTNIVFSNVQYLQDSLEKDSLLEFRVDRISYSGMDLSLLKKILTNINDRVFPTQENRAFLSSEIHYAYDEANKKIYAGKTYVSIETDGVFTEVTVLWAKPSRNQE